METYLPISYLNDFVFCPYSIYLHQVYDNTNTENYNALPQTNGKNAHKSIDNTSTNKAQQWKGIYVISNKLGVYGKIDTYYPKSGKLVEHKYQLTTIYKGYYYQLWAQYFSLIEMGIKVNEISFYTYKDNKTIEVQLPTISEFEELKQHIKKIARFNFTSNIIINPEKCKRCIYAALCDKTQIDHVYA